MWAFKWHIYLWRLTILKVEVKDTHFELGISCKRYRANIILPARSRSCIFWLGIYLKWKQIGQTLLLPKNMKLRMTFWLAYLHLPLEHSKGQVMHIWTGNISQTVTGRANIVIANKYDIAYGLSIVIFIFDLGLLSRSWSRSCTCRQRISLKDEANITIAIKYEVAYWLSISIFRFGFGPV